MTETRQARRSPVAWLLARMRRLQLKRVHPPVLAWVIACWAVTLGIIVAVLWPGGIASVVAGPVESADGLVGFEAPAWYRLLSVVAGAVIAGALVVAYRTPARDDHPALRSFVGGTLISVALVIPVLVLFADHAWLLGAVALALAVGSVVVMRRTTLRVVPALLAAGAWLGVVVHQFGQTGAAPSSWTWIALPGLAAGLASFGAYYGVARAAESRTRAIRVLFRERWKAGVVLLVALAAAVILVLRFTVLRELFPQPDPVLWFPWDRYWTSWPLAAIVAGVLVVVSVRSTRQPLLRVGQRRVTVGLAILGNFQLVVAALLVVVGMVMAIVGQVDVPQGIQLVVPWFKVAGVTLLGLLMLLPQLTGTAARWLGIVAALFLVPNTLASALGPLAPAGFAPSPVQVTMLLVGAALVLAVLNLVRTPVRPSLVARLAVVPIVAVHAGWLLPAAWTQLGLIVGVVLMFVGLLVLQPPAARDNTTHSARVVTGAVQQLAGLTVALLAAPLLIDDPSIVVLGLIWLSVVVVAALCIETVAREPERVPPTVPPVERAPEQAPDQTRPRDSRP